MNKTFTFLFGASSIWLLWKLHQNGVIHIPIIASPKVIVKPSTSLFLPVVLFMLSVYIISEAESIIYHCQKCLSGFSIDCCLKAGINNKTLQNKCDINFNDLNDDIITQDYLEKYCNSSNTEKNNINKIHIEKCHHKAVNSENDNSENNYSDDNQSIEVNYSQSDTLEEEGSSFTNECKNTNEGEIKEQLPSLPVEKKRKK